MRPRTIEHVLLELRGHASIHLHERGAAVRFRRARRKATHSSVLRFPPELQDGGHRVEEARRLRPRTAAFHDHRRTAGEQPHRDAERAIRRQEVEHRTQLAPDRDDALVGDGTISEVEHVRRVVVRVQAGDPSGTDAPKVERQLAAVTPLGIARLHGHTAHVAAADTAQRVGDDRALRTELRVVGEVLELAPAAVVNGIVRTGWRHARRRR